MGEATPVADLVPPEVQDQQSDEDRGRDEVARGSSAIWERIRLHAEDRLTTVELHAHQLFDRDLSPEEVAAAVSASDALAVDFGRLELPSIAHLARHLSKTFSAAELSPTTAVHIASTTDDVRTLLSSAIAQQTALAPTADAVVVLGPASPELDAICWVVQARGHTIIHEEAVLPGGVDNPAGVIASAPGEFSFALRSLLRALTEQWAAPIVMLHDSEDPETLRKLANFSTTMLTLDTSPDVIAAELKRAIIAQESQPTALVCGEARDAASLLAEHGFDIHTVPGPDELQSAIQGRHCAVVFGPNVASSVVFELARLIRATPSLRRTPLIWLSEHNEDQWLQATRLDIFAVEALDDGLTSRLGALLRKASADIAETDHLSRSVLAWAAAQVLVDRALVAAHRNSNHVALATLRFGEGVPPERIDALKEVLSTEFRRGDIIGMRSPQDLVVALEGVSRRVATNRMTSLMSRLDLGDGNASVGVALFPTDGRSAEELAAAADRASDLSAKHLGPAVVSTTWRPITEQVADALVVDGDPVLGRVLVSGLNDHSVRAELIEDGREALDQLVVGDGTSLPRLLLLDLDSPGIDGISMLRQLRGSGVLSQLHVLLMTARSSESDLRVALDLGVADVIRKPFSATLLMHRVGRLLEDAR